MDDIFDDIDKRLDNIATHGTGRYYRPLADAVDEFIRFSENPQLRVFTGIPLFDQVIRGVAPGELCLINGFAHSGKTVLATEILMANSTEPVVLFTPDETRTAVLTKLTSADQGIGAEELERRIRQQDAEARQILVNVAEKYSHLAVYDESVTLHMMDTMMKEATEALGAKPKAVVFDYAEQLNESMDVKGKIDSLKRFGKKHGVAFFVLHQSSRSKGAGGQALDIDSGAYGGEQQATFLFTVRRKIAFYNDQLRELEFKAANATNPTIITRYEDRMREIRYELIPAHMDTVSIGLAKNKRPPMLKVPETDFRLMPETGRLVLIEKDDPDDVPDVPEQTGIVFANSSRELLG